MAPWIYQRGHCRSRSTSWSASGESYTAPFKHMSHSLRWSEKITKPFHQQSQKKIKPPIHENKVNWCLARYSPRATTTNQPTNRAPNEPARPGPKWSKMPISGQIWPFWGQKILIFTGKSKSFGTYIGKCLAQNDQKCQFLAKFGRFGAKKFLSGTKSQFIVLE